ncbi:MAG: sporulation protein YqfC [Clostridia bacterium]|nr:sporulation protein YqfC [Clostridia bacterium]
MKKTRPAKRVENKKSRTQRLSSLLEIPLDMVADVPRITLNDNRELSVENYKSIEGYEPDEIILRSKNYRIIITGKSLQIIAITNDEILIQGTVCGLSFV